MKAILQIFRQPGKSFSGLILCALSVTILVASGGQYCATVLTRANLDDRYDTLALVSAEYFNEKNGDTMTHYTVWPEEYQGWVAETIRTHPDLVEKESYSGGISAYIPEMRPDNFSRHEEGGYEEGYNDGNPYRCALFEVTLKSVGTIPYEEKGGYSDGGSDEYVEIRYSVSRFCMGTIDRVIGLEEGFVSPEGKSILLKVKACDEAALEAMHLEVGGRYLAYGMDYSDVRGREKRNLYRNFREGLEELLGADLSEEAFDEKADCFMSVCDYASFASHAPDEDGTFIVSAEKRNYYTKLPDLDNKCKITLVPADAYIPDYRVPTMAKLEGEAEDYLASEEGALWRQALEEMEVNNHGFPVLAVEKLGYQAAFARRMAVLYFGAGAKRRVSLPERILNA